MYIFMNDVGASIFMLVLFIMLLIVPFKRINLTTKLSVALALLLLLISIPLVGHSQWNLETRLVHELNYLNGLNLVYDTDTKAVKEIQKLNHPLQIKHISSIREPFTGGTLFSNEVVEINGNKYNVRLACYLTPLPFTPYETWKINRIEKVQSQ